MRVLKKTIKALLEENFIYARALHYLGVDFFRNENETLEQICVKNEIDPQRMIRSFYRFDTKSRIPFHEINEYPLALVVVYLRFAHQNYIKNALPFIGELLKELNSKQSLLQDLAQVFPLFVEDFILHIYQEEDELFGYIESMLRARNNDSKHLSNYIAGDQPSLSSLLDQHESDDEMASLRELVDDVTEDSFLTKLIVNEIRAFDRELLYHAAIENEILFPKAMQLEKELRDKVEGLSRLN